MTPGACAGVIAFFAYLAIFLLTRSSQAFWLNLSSAVINAGSATALAAGFMALIGHYLIGRSLRVQAPAHAVLALAFCYLWYLAVIVLNGIRGGSLSEGFQVNPFVSVARTWQWSQGFAIYAVLALGAYLLYYRAELMAERARAARLETELARKSEPAGARPAEALRKLMVRGAEGLIGLDIGDILYVRAAGDGVEIVTRDGVMESRKTLTALSDTLPEPFFVRAHRSVLVNREAILAAEPAGNGRLTLHLAGGESVTTSRSGARALREAAL